MAVFCYNAVDVAGRQSSGTLLADTPLDGRQRLRDRGLDILDFAPAQAKRAGRLPWIGPRRRREECVAEIARYLSLLLRAGVPLAQALEVVTQERNDRLATVLKKVRESVTAGSSLADSLAEHEAWFDALFVSAVRVGELTGELDEALSQLATHLRKQQTLRSRVSGALTYPVILLIVGVAVVIFLMSFVVPQLLTVLIASGRPLPTSTMILKTGSDLLVQHWPWFLVIGGAATTTGAAFYRSEPGRRLCHRAQLRAPILGPLVRKTLVARFAQRMALLLRTGIPFVEAVRTVAAMTTNRVLADELDAMARSVESGGEIVRGLDRSRIFPPVVVHLIGVGQESGELTGMLSDLKDRYETEVEIALTRFTAALEPLLIIVLAAGVGFVVFACLMPILEATKGIA